VKQRTSAVTTFEEMLEVAVMVGPKTVAVAAAADPEVLIAADEVERKGIAHCHLVGDRAAIQAIAQREGLSLRDMEITHQPDPVLAAEEAVRLAREGLADVVAKGQLKTEQLLSIALDRQRGIRRSRLLTHVGIFEIPSLDRLIYISDSGVVLYPTIYQKLEIIQNAVEVARQFGIERPRVAILAASETVHPKVPSSIDALALSRMAAQGWVDDAVVEGPLPLDAAISSEAARIKNLNGEVAGRADILIVPSVEAGNTMAKSILYFANGRMAGLVVGAKVPIIINSRADEHITRVLSIAMAVVLAHTQAAFANPWIK
jgi:phosphate butyryltransferase